MKSRLARVASTGLGALLAMLLLASPGGAAARQALGHIKHVPGAPIGPPRTAPSPAASQLARIMAAARAATAVHYVTKVPDSHGSMTIVGDAGVSIGIQRITFRRGGVVGRAIVVATPDAAYVKGAASTLGRILNLSPSAAKAYAGRWVEVPRSDHAFGDTAASVRIGSLLGELTFPNENGDPVTLLPESTVRGHRVLGVQRSYGQDYVIKLYASAAGAPLPVQENVTHGGVTFTFSLDAWNEKLHIGVPHGATAVSIARSAA